MLPRFLHLFCLSLCFAAALCAQAARAATCSAPPCTSTLFVDAIAEQNWVNIDVAPHEGTLGIRSAFIIANRDYQNRPVRIRLAPGTYADNLGGEIYAQRVIRSETTPIWLYATDSRPNATRIGHGINLLGVAYIAIEGMTIGPEEVGAWNAATRSHADPQPLQAGAGIHVAGSALYADQNANLNGSLNTAVYGQFQPSHHIIVRNVTIQNLFEADAESGETSIGAGMDGMKFNQVEDLWVLNSRVRQTSRHGIDNVGVHRALFADNIIANTGGGQGLEAKGGAVDIWVERNLFYKVRRMELGGENTDASYYFSSDGRWDYEALRMIVRDNLIIDPREAGIEFAGCTDCAAIGNTVFYTADYQVPQDGGTVYGGDAVRVHDSMILDAGEGAGSDCQFWDGTDYVTVNPCWGVGSNAPAPVRRVLRSANVVVQNNAFISVTGHFSNALGGSTIPCPLNVIDGSADLHFDGNYWFNGNSPLPASGCSDPGEGSHSVYSTSVPATSPGLGTSVQTSSFANLLSSAQTALTPAAGSVLSRRGLAVNNRGSLDQARVSRPNPPSIGALEALSEGQSKFNGARSTYSISRSGEVVIVTSKDGVSYRLQNPQRLQFDDLNVAFDLAGVAGKAYRIYQAAFDRVPDVGGLGFWIANMDKNVSLLQVAGGFIASAEFTSLYGSNPSNENFVTRLYNNVLHRAPEGGGYAFWVNALKQGVSRAEVLAAFAESAENIAQVAGAVANGINYKPQP